MGLDRFIEATEVEHNINKAARFITVTGFWGDASGERSTGWERMKMELGFGMHGGLWGGHVGVSMRKAGWV